jgi:hypothetical protein
MTETETQSTALFFYFAFLDDQKAIEAATRALVFCRDRKRKNPELKSSVALVVSTKTIWNRYKARIARGRPNTSIESGWLIP